MWSRVEYVRQNAANSFFDSYHTMTVSNWIDKEQPKCCGNFGI